MVWLLLTVLLAWQQQFLLVGKILSENIVFTETLRNQWDFWISRQKQLTMSAIRVYEPGVQYSVWSSNKLDSVEVWPTYLHIWRSQKHK